MTFALAQPLRGGFLGAVNPVTKLASVFVLSGVLILTIDWVSALVALTLEIVVFLAVRVPLGAVALRLLPLVIAAALAGFTTVLYGRSTGVSYFSWWSVDITDGSISLGVATALRILAIGVPAVVLFLTIDPTDLADGLSQIAHLPARFVIGGLAALRLIGLFVDDWRALELARRARGVADRGRLKRLAGQIFSLLVLSIRRGSKLATAMEARGFGSDRKRTWARRSVLSTADGIVLLIGCGIAGSAVVVSVATGSWNFVLG